MRKPSDKSEDQPQTIFEFIIERLGFVFFSVVAGLIYAGVICITLFLFKIEVQSRILLNSFMLVFGFFGAILGQNITPIIMSTIYGLMYLWGVFLGFVGYELPYLVNEDHFPQKSEYLWCVMLGIFAVVVFMFIK